MTKIGKIKQQTNKAAFEHRLLHAKEEMDWLYSELLRIASGELILKDWSYHCDDCGQDHTGSEFSR